MERTNHKVKHLAFRGRPRSCVSMSSLSNSVEFGYKNGEKGDSATTLKVKKRKPSASSSGYRTPVLRSRSQVEAAVTSTSKCYHPCTVLSWLIDNNVVSPSEKVRYCSAKGSDPVVEGKVCREGIKCNCCHKVFTLSGFENHAGCSNYRPAANIYMEDGKSLLDCQMQVMTNRGKRVCRPEPHDVLEGSVTLIENDNFCTICQDGGDLILCDRCPSVFHKNCIGLEDVPDGDWFCPACSCGICGNSIVPTVHNQTCGQCERKYHTGCLSVEVGPKENWFCSNDCEKIFLSLQEHLGGKNSVGVGNLTWTLWKPVKSNSDFPNEPDDAATESYTKLSLALQVMQECFKHLKEPRTGRHLAEDIIFSRGSTFDGTHCRGFYTVLLEENDALITAATVRIYGGKVAEIPLIGTRSQHRQKGMCRVIMSILEKMLLELGVERLVLPIHTRSVGKWNRSFGFSVIKGLERLQFMDYRFISFEDSIMCQKCLTRTSLAEAHPPKEAKYAISKEISNSGFTPLIPQDELHDHSKGLLVEDTCIIKAHAAVPMAHKRISSDQKTGSATLRPVKYSNQGQGHLLNTSTVKILDPSSATQATTGFEHATPFHETSSSEQPGTNILDGKINPSFRLESMEVPDASSVAREVTSFRHMAAPQDTANFEQVYIEISDSSTDPSIVEEFEGVSSTSPSDLMNILGLANINQEYVPLLQDACSWRPSLIECQKESSPLFAECAFTLLGKVLHVLKTKKVKDMTTNACNDLETSWKELKAFGFDLTWLEPHVNTALGMRKYVEKAADVKRLEENVKALESELERLEAKLVAARNDLEKAEECFDERIMDCELGYIH